MITPGGVKGHSPNIEIVPSKDAGNIFDLGSDGKPFVPAPKVLNFIDTNTVDFTQTGNDVKADVRIDPSSSAPVTVTANGIKVDCCPLPTPLEFDDSSTVDFTQTGNHVTAVIKLDSSSTAPVSITPNGIKVDCCPPVDVNINDIQGLSFTKSVSNNVITFTPKFDWVYIASQVCPLCPAAPMCSPVVGLSVSNETVNSMVVSWTGNGSVGYTVRYKPVTSSTWTSLPSQTATTATLTGLTPGTSYLIEVINDCGGGLNATSSTVGTTQYANCPAITDLSVTVG